MFCGRSARCTEEASKKASEETVGRRRDTEADFLERIQQRGGARGGTGRQRDRETNRDRATYTT